MPLTWPLGTYGLMKTPKGCPGEQANWYGGWRKQDTEDTDASNYFTNNINHYLAGKTEAHNYFTNNINYYLTDTL